MTDFTVIYGKFLSKIEDYGYAQLSKEDADDHFRKYLSSAIVQFRRICRKDLSLTTKTGFIEDLEESEIEILASWMVVSHIEGNMVTEENMRNFLNSRDYRQYSSANLLKVLIETKDTFKIQVQRMMADYDLYYFMRDWRDSNGK